MTLLFKKKKEVLYAENFRRQAFQRHPPGDIKVFKRWALGAWEPFIVLAKEGSKEQENEN